MRRNGSFSIVARRPWLLSSRGAPDLENDAVGRVSSLDGEVVLPVAGSALAADELLFPRQLGAAGPQPAPSPFFPLVDEPVVVALVSDVTFGSVERGRANAFVELEMERCLHLVDVDRFDADRVSKLAQRVARDPDEDPLIVRAQLGTIDPDELGRDGAAERAV